jgi:hypothetical protein
MGDFPNEHAAARPFPETQRQAKWSSLEATPAAKAAIAQENWMEAASPQLVWMFRAVRAGVTV